MRHRMHDDEKRRGALSDLTRSGRTLFPTWLNRRAHELDNPQLDEPLDQELIPEEERD